MKPHPRIRKTIKWGGAAVTVLLVVVWIVSGSWSLGWTSASGTFVLATAGTVGWGELGALPPPQSPGWFVQSTRGGWQWWIAEQRGPGGYWAWSLPLAWPAVLTAILCAIAWRRDMLAHRRTGLNLCPKCDYDRTGLAKGAVCPECGSLPT
jgi:hypothetical protein